MKKEIVYNIVCNGEDCVAVKMENAVHLMTLKEWKHTYGRLHPEKWKNGEKGKHSENKNSGCFLL